MDSIIKLRKLSKESSKYSLDFTGASNGGGNFPTPKLKFFCRKWSFPRAVPHYRGTGTRDRKMEKRHFPLRFLYVNFKRFSTNFNSYWFLAETHKNLPLGFLNSFRIIKDFH